MLARRGFRLATLGRLTLASAAGEVETVLDARPRHLAILTVLALAPRAIPRGRLVEMFWGGETEERARHSLSNALSALRALLGANAISARRDDVGLSEDVPLEIDALQFTAACEVRDDERAATLYAGPFLADVHVADAPEFDRWLARQRQQLQHQFLQLCERQVPALLRAARWTEGADLARRWLDAAPDSTPAFTSVLRAESGPDTPAALRGALAEFERLRDTLRDDHGIRPASAVHDLVSELHERLVAAEEGAGDAAASIVPAQVATMPSIAPRSSSRMRRWSVGLAGAAGIVVVIIGLWATRRRAVAAPEYPRPIVAVTTIDDVRGDTSMAWLQAGLPRLIASDLDDLGGMDVLPPSRVREVIARLAGTSSARLTEDQSVDVAHRLGATTVVTGGVSTANGGYLLDVTTRSVSDPRQSESFTVFASGPVELGRLAASRLATLLGTGSGGTNSTARYSGIETASADAYRHFVRGMTAMEAEQLTEASRELDAAIAADSGFVQAIRARRDIAAYSGDAKGEHRLTLLAARYENRLPELERLTDAAHGADTLGESARAEALSAQLVQRFPRDPRAHAFRADVLSGHGRWAAAESVLIRALALDSLAMTAGTGPCTPCEMLWRLSQTRLAEGNAGGAESAARRWVALQPDLPSAWHNFAATLAAVGRSDEAVSAGFHLIALAREPPMAVDFGRTMLAARRYDIVDSLVTVWGRTRDPILVDGARDLRSMLQRERGQFAASVVTLAGLSPMNGISLVRADGLARIGRLAEARQIFEISGHPRTAAGTGQFTGPEARGFSWAHALEADALLRAGDTTAARPLADSILHAGEQSYYGRDRLLHHHVRGMLYFAEHRFADAERELRAALWTANGWTRTNVELARAQLAQGHATDAIVTLRDAQLAALDGMGRYVPKSELDWWMARAFSAAGRRDSAARYAAFARAAWKDADLIVRARLDSLSR